MDGDSRFYVNEETSLGKKFDRKYLDQSWHPFPKYIPMGTNCVQFLANLPLYSNDMRLRLHLKSLKVVRYTEDLTIKCFNKFSNISIKTSLWF